MYSVKEPVIYFKSCPRCDGDVQPGEDIYGTFITCLQCGFGRDTVDDRSKERARFYFNDGGPRKTNSKTGQSK